MLPSGSRSAVRRCSVVQFAAQPSPPKLLPSSQSSPASFTPLPQIALPPVGVGVGVTEVQPAQPHSAAFTALMSSLISTVPLPSSSQAGQVVTGALPSAMFTQVTNSLISTEL